MNSMNNKIGSPKDWYIYSRLDYFNKIVKNTGECITRKMTDEEKVKYCCK